MTVPMRPALARRRRLWRWETAVAMVAFVAAVAVFVVTINAKFLAYPYWLAVQKADFILGPVFVGLYWHRRRPANRLGAMLIGLGLVAIPYIGESSSRPLLFTLGTLTEAPIFFMWTAVLLAFPNGRLDGWAERLILVGVLLGLVLPYLVWVFVLPVFNPGNSIAGCRAYCPANPLAVVSSMPSWYPTSGDISRGTVIVTSLAIIGLYAWRWVTGTPPRRRALAIGTPVALVFVLTQGTYNLLSLISAHFVSFDTQPLTSPFQWTVAAARSLMWYGFLFALIAAELFAGRTLSGLVRDSLGRPSFRELQGMVRVPLGDPGLRLGFWRSGQSDWADVDGEVLAPPGPDQRLTEFDRDGRPAIAIVHDSQLSEDPELLRTVGAVALLALENAELDSAWKDSLGELADSRARLVSAGDRERRRLERDLHDGAQQKLMAIQFVVRVAQEEFDEAALAGRLEAIGSAADDAVDALRSLAHGIYPRILRDLGLLDALTAFARTVPTPIEIVDRGIGRGPRPVEGAIYFCATEAIQNSLKHAGADVHVVVTLGRDRAGVEVAIADDGVGMEKPASGEGDGLIGMRDRIGAVGGTLEIISARGQGTTVRGRVPLDKWDTASTDHQAPESAST